LGKSEEKTEDGSYQAVHQKSSLMNSIDFESLVITIFVLVDDWYQVEGKALKALSPGAKKKRVSFSRTLPALSFVIS